MKATKLVGLVFAAVFAIGVYAAETKTVPQTAPVGNVAAAKVTQKEAKKQCKKENAKLKGQELQDCIKAKQSNG